MSGVTRTLTRRPSVARFRAARFSSGVLYLAGRLSSASLSGLSGSGLPFVCVFAMDSMLPAIVPADPDITGPQGGHGFRARPLIVLAAPAFSPYLW